MTVSFIFVIFIFTFSAQTFWRTLVFQMEKKKLESVCVCVCVPGSSLSQVCDQCLSAHNHLSKWQMQQLKKKKKSQSCQNEVKYELWLLVTWFPTNPQDRARFSLEHQHSYRLEFTIHAFFSFLTRMMHTGIAVIVSRCLLLYSHTCRMTDFQQDCADAGT